jgi:hypothetical protein
MGTSGRTTVRIRLQNASNELNELERLLSQNTEAIDPRVLQECRESVNHLRECTSAVKQWIDLRNRKGDAFSALAALSAERVRPEPKSVKTSPSTWTTVTSPSKLPVSPSSGGPSANSMTGSHASSRPERDGWPTFARIAGELRVPHPLRAGGPFKPSFGLSEAVLATKLSPCLGDCKDFTNPDRPIS